MALQRRARWGISGRGLKAGNAIALARVILVLLLAIFPSARSAVIFGTESWDDIAEFTEAKFAWLQSILDLSDRPPSAGTFKRVVAALDPGQVQTVFASSRKAVATILPDDVIALDGTTLRDTVRNRDDRSLSRLTLLKCYYEMAVQILPEKRA